MSASEQWKMMTQIVSYDLGIIPQQDISLINTLSTEERRKVTRKFRKLWKRELKKQMKETMKKKMPRSKKRRKLKANDLHERAMHNKNQRKNLVCSLVFELTRRLINDLRKDDACW